MGFENREEGSYIGIYAGKFTERVKEGTARAVSRVNKIGKTVHEIYHDAFTGYLVGIATSDNPTYGKVWNFKFKDSEKEYTLSLPYSNGQAKAFLKMLPNIDVSKKMKLSPSMKKDENGKDKTSLFVNQEGNVIKHAYTRDNPNGMPEMKQVKVKGLLQWDDTEQLEFLHEMVKTKILPKLGKTVTDIKQEKKTPADEAGIPDDENEDEIPF